MDSDRQASIVIMIDGPVRPEDVPAVCAAIKARLEHGQASIVVFDASSLAPEASSVDLLARLTLVARRAGLASRIANTSAELRALVHFVGLAAVLGVEPSRQSEQPEQLLGIEEEGDFGDLAG